MTTTRRLAPAKINLTLHVTGQRADGYHLLDSLVVFAQLGDTVTLTPAQDLSLRLDGPQAAGLQAEGDNLILRAARLMGQGGAFSLTKVLPVASGMGGGSSDAAAALHLMAQAGAARPTTAQAMTLGADLPVCLQAPTPARMTGLGEGVAPVAGVPALSLVLVNPGVHLSTPVVFRALASKQNAPMPATLPHWPDVVALARWLETQRNDLEPPACALAPQIQTVLNALSAQPGCLLARMTGSGATCFGIFASDQNAQAACQALARPGWFTEATRTTAS